jgi:CDP-paratose 2-epimerase
MKIAQLKHALAGPVLITGGAGFIGSNLADAMMGEGRDVIVFDNLSRKGVEQNLHWLRRRHGKRLTFRSGDLRDKAAVAAAVASASAVMHLAAQVAVTASLDDPWEDFSVNMVGTMHLLEAIRGKGGRMPLVFASTNKVYGDLGGIETTVDGERHVPQDSALAACGINEAMPLNFATPYGCSKGAADQYVLDYARSFGIAAVVLRMSCIYGPRQFGTEDQGWVAHFLLRALDDETLTLYGDGRQVRDILHVQDAVRAWMTVLADAESLAGRAFNLGGGPGNAVSLIELLREIEQLTGRSVRRDMAAPRQGDQLWYVSDTTTLARATGWRAAIRWQEGLADLMGWLEELLARRQQAAQAELRSANA